MFPVCPAKKLEVICTPYRSVDSVSHRFFSSLSNYFLSSFSRGTRSNTTVISVRVHTHTHTHTHTHAIGHSVYHLNCVWEAVQIHIFMDPFIHSFVLWPCCSCSSFIGTRSLNLLHFVVLIEKSTWSHLGVDYFVKQRSTAGANSLFQRHSSHVEKATTHKAKVKVMHDLQGQDHNPQSQERMSEKSQQLLSSPSLCVY